MIDMLCRDLWKSLHKCINEVASMDKIQDISGAIYR